MSNVIVYKNPTTSKIEVTKNNLNYINPYCIILKVECEAHTTATNLSLIINEAKDKYNEYDLKVFLNAMRYSLLTYKRKEVSRKYIIDNAKFIYNPLQFSIWKEGFDKTTQAISQRK